MALNQLILFIYDGPDTYGPRKVALFVPVSGYKGTLIYAASGEGFWRVRLLEDYFPFRSNYGLVGANPVCQMRQSPNAILSVLTTVPARDEPRYTSQQWVGDALQTLVNCGYVTKAEQVEALDYMSDNLAM